MKTNSKTDTKQNAKFQQPQLTEQSNADKADRVVDSIGKNSTENYNDDCSKVNNQANNKAGLKLLKNGGMLAAYKHLMISLCKNGLPTGNLFEYAAYTVLEYEKKWKQIKSKEKKEMVSKYWEEKGGKDKGKHFKIILLNRSQSHGKSEEDIDVTQRSHSEKKIKTRENRSKHAEKEKDTSDRSKSQTNKKDKLKKISNSGENVNLKPVQTNSEKVSSNLEQIQNNLSNGNNTKSIKQVSEKIENAKTNSKEKKNQNRKKSK